MKQFTDIRLDSVHCARAARTKQVELQIGETIMAIKRAVRKTSLYRTMTLSQYDQLIIKAEKALRSWMVTAKDKTFDDLLEVVGGVASQLTDLASADELNDLNQKIKAELVQLNNAGVFRF